METKGVTCKIPLELHNRISEEIRASGSTMGKFIEMVINSYYEEKEKGVKIMGNQRTMAFQVSEELFQKIKDYLAEYERVYHRKLTQKEFVIGLVEQALEEAEEEFAAARAAQGEVEAEDFDEDGADPDEAEAADEDDTDPDEAEDADEDGTEPGEAEDATEGENELDEAEDAAEGEDEPNEIEDADENGTDPDEVGDADENENAPEY